MNARTPLRVVMADPKPERADFVSAFVRQIGGKLAACVSSIDELTGVVHKTSPQLILAAIDSADSDALNAMKKDIREWNCPLVVYGGPRDQDSIVEAIEAGVSVYVTEDIRNRDIEPMLRVALARFRKDKSVDNELQLLRQKHEERSMVDKAKALLMRQHDLDESAAHQTLQQLAMNQRIPLREAAGNVVAMLSVISRK